MNLPNQRPVQRPGCAKHSTSDCGCSGGAPYFQVESWLVGSPTLGQASCRTVQAPCHHQLKCDEDARIE
eukprot:1920091-Prorocentrum_lima.AAC.1